MSLCVCVRESVLFVKLYKTAQSDLVLLINQPTKQHVLVFLCACPKCLGFYIEKSASLYVHKYNRASLTLPREASLPTQKPIRYSTWHSIGSNHGDYVEVAQKSGSGS